jgi:hypothetical protein
MFDAFQRAGVSKGTTNKQLHRGISRRVYTTLINKQGINQVKTYASIGIVIHALVFD